MAITASFEADFSNFNAEVQKAEKGLQAFEGTTQQTGTAIGSMGTVATTTAPGINTLRSSYQQFDGVLNSVGIHIGPQIKALDDIAGAAGKTAGQLGILGTAGLTLGTAIAGWKLGRMVAEFFGLDEAIANTTAKLLGFGDVAAEVAGAKQDTINAAIGRGADAMITYTEAIKFNTDWLKNHKTAAKEASDAYKDWTKANQDVTIAAQDYRVVLQQVSGSTVEAAKFALDHGASQKSVATAYELTVPQIAAVVSALAAEKDALTETAKEQARVTAELQKHADAVIAIRDKVFGKDALDQADLWVEAVESMGGTLDALTTGQLAELETAMMSALDVMARTGLLTNEVSSAYGALMVAAQNAQAAHGPLTAAVQDFTKSEYEAALASDALALSLNKQKDEAAAVAAQMKTVTSYSGVNVPTSESLSAVGRDPRSFLGAPIGRTMQTGLGSVSNTPWASLQPGVHVEPGAFVLNYPIVNDPAAMDQLGRLVGDSIMSRVTRTGTRV